MDRQSWSLERTFKVAPMWCFGGYVTHWNCLLAEPAWRRLSICSSIQSLPYCDPSGTHSLHQPNESDNGSGNAASLRLQNQRVLQGEMRCVREIDLNEPLIENRYLCSIKNYHDIWNDLRILSTNWKRVLLPTQNTFDMGASEAIYSSLSREKILDRTSPIVYLRAQKNDVEREGMQRAHIRDAVALCDTFSYLEERVSQGTVHIM